ncbi:MAG TPA: DegV family protein, partial [Caldilineae bacterium]|nr:DegV family protein [Caldilineae bacterium]
MSTIRIVTDSSAHLTPEEIEQYGITIIPLRVRMGRKLYKEVTELSYEEYFRRLQSMKTLPTSESPQLQEFIDL